MKSFYLRNLKPKLTDLVQLSRGTESPVDKLSLQEELDMTRVLASAQIDALLECALTPVDSAASEDEQKKQWAAKFSAGELCKKALADVSSMVQKAAQVRSLSTDAATVEDIQYVMDQVIAVIQQVVEPVDPTMAATLCMQLHNVRMPMRERNLPDQGALLLKAVEEIATIQTGKYVEQNK